MSEPKPPNAGHEPPLHDDDLAERMAAVGFDTVPRDGEWYTENGFMVFTAAYHRRRGFCCRSSCRHCPYGLATE